MRISWEKSENPVLQANQAHVWLVPICSYAGQVLQYLDAEEKRRHQRFKFDKDKRQFAVSHNVLRKTLGHYLGCHPAEVKFQYNTHQKPHLADTPLHFNLSHSGDFALIAVTLDTPIGADIERVQNRMLDDAIVERFFSASECLAYNALSTHQKLEGFYHAWTCKEAFIKAIGEGVFYGLDQFDVQLIPGEEARVLSVKNDQKAAEKWQMHGFSPAEHYCAAVAWEGPKKELVFLRDDE